MPANRPSPTAPPSPPATARSSTRGLGSISLVALGLLLTACSSDTPPAAAPVPPAPASPSAPLPSSPAAPTTAVTATAATATAAAAKKPAAPPAAAPAPAGPAVARLDRFVAAVQQQLPAIVVDRRDEEVAAIGELACTSRAAGKRTATVVAEIEDAGVTETDARRLLTIAEKTACRD